MKKIITRFYYTWADIVDLFQTEIESWQYPDAPLQEAGQGETVTWNTVLNQPLLLASLNSSTAAPLLLELLDHYVWPEYWDSSLIYIDVEHDVWEEPTEPTDNEILEASISIRGRIARWLIASADRYVPLINSLSEIKDSLLERLGSKSTVLFNDTPQSSNGTFFAGDNYVTNVSQTSTETDAATPIARLKEIENNLSSLYANWADEFSRFVIFSD